VSKIMFGWGEESGGGKRKRQGGKNEAHKFRFSGGEKI